MIGRYHSNDWIIPIVDEARPILDSFPRETALEVAATTLKASDIGQVDIPWVTIFPSDDKGTVSKRLLEVLKKPDGQTLAFEADTFLAVESLKGILARHDAFGHLGAYAAYHMVQAAAGKEDETFLTYQDKSRKYPQYATEWAEDLVRQFGSEGFEQIRQLNPELTLLMGQTAAIADWHYQQTKIQQDGESPTELIGRALEFFDISTVEGLQDASRILERGFSGYRRLTYQARGLAAPSDD